MAQGEVGIEIKAFRDRARLTQEELGLRIGATAGTVYRWEKGQPVGNKDGLLTSLNKEFPKENFDGLRDAMARAPARITPIPEVKKAPASKNEDQSPAQPTSSNSLPPLPDAGVSSDFRFETPKEVQPMEPESLPTAGADQEQKKTDLLVRQWPSVPRQTNRERWEEALQSPFFPGGGSQEDGDLERLISKIGWEIDDKRGRGRPLGDTLNGARDAMQLHLETLERDGRADLLDVGSVQSLLAQVQRWQGQQDQQNSKPGFLGRLWVRLIGPDEPHPLDATIQRVLSSQINVGAGLR